MSSPPHVEVVAYALGLLDPEDHEAFELHLVECADCQEELRELADVPALLDEVRSRRPRG
ncbi:zf-HC2 domain-containing protein [Thermostaphylospora chromogena]|uniref:Putative zinc-finger n=1 Tax=Thermostaphylospora chromogena TaxID=35622 RepID=A0A1H1DSH1_9ACTN|nr:zf-HC2 domain-containing protein [Thermostaphylospora chromogena]SDQ79209.1 Putative zinc-finger [Thermostaphylospora chromogena]